MTRMSVHPVKCTCGEIVGYCTDEMFSLHNRVWCRDCAIDYQTGKEMKKDGEKVK